MNVAPPQIIVLMGVSGCGKTTVGRALAPSIGAVFIDGDHFHPLPNVRKMAAGVALTDADRAGWLDTLAARLASAVAAGESVVLACSALKRSYRDALRRGAPALRLVYLHGTPDVLARRIGAREGHYMPPTLLPSQLATLEAPQADEAAIAQPIDRGVDVIVRELLQQLTPTPRPAP